MTIGIEDYQESNNQVDDRDSDSDDAANEGLENEEEEDEEEEEGEEDEEGEEEKGNQIETVKIPKNKKSRWNRNTNNNNDDDLVIQAGDDYAMHNRRKEFLEDREFEMTQKAFGEDEDRYN